MCIAENRYCRKQKTMKRPLLFLAVCFSLIGSAAIAQSINPAPGIPGACGNPSITRVYSPQTPQDGNGTMGMTYNQTLCGLTYVQASQMITTRYSPPGTGFPSTLAISGIPSCYAVEAAYLYWIVSYQSGSSTSPTVSLTNPSAATATFPGLLIGSAPAKCWAENGCRTFRADVTSAVSGNGNYVINNITGNTTWEVDGATLVIIYRDISATWTGTVIIHDGCASFAGGTFNYNMTGFSACAAGSNATAFCLVSDMQNNISPTFNATLNGTPGVYPRNFYNCALTPTTVFNAQSTSNFLVSDFSDCFAIGAVGLAFQTNCLTCNIAPLTLNTTTTPATCLACNGTATVTPATPGTYTYSWAPSGGNAATATGLCPGTYTVTVSDGCQTTNTVVTITSIGSTASTETHVDPVCNNSCTGTATVTPTGGTAPYTYSWAPSGGTGASASGLCAGTYTVTITDANGCVTQQLVTLTQPGALNVSISTVSASCNPGSATATPSGGTGPYTYSWAPSGGTNPTENNLSAGTYTVTVTDANNCSTQQQVTITQAGTLSTTSNIVANVSCNGGSNGSATVTASGGSGPYTYSWSPSGGTNATATGLAAGTYIVTVTDANNCTTTQQVIITQPQVLAASTSGTGASCNNGTNGTATATPSGGTGPYTYSWSPSGGTNATATGLGAGTYVVSVTDANGCTTTQSYVVTQPTPVTAATSGTPTSCNNGNNGTATATPSGGTGPYTYSWSPSGGTNATANNLTAGTYTVTVTDANGCTGQQQYIVTQPSAVTVATTGTSVACNGGITGSATATASGGNGPYTYSWLPSGGTNATANGLSAGLYTVTVTDANGCTALQLYTVTEPAVLAATATGDLVCPGATANPLAVANGGTGPYNYSWQPGNLSGSSPSVTVSQATTFTVTITDANGCTQTATTTVSMNPAPQANFTTNAVNGVYVLPPTAGQLCYTGTSTNVTGWLWNFDNGAATSLLQSPCFPVSAPGTYCASLVVVNSDGCLDTASVCILVGESYYSVPNVFTPNNDGSNDAFIITNEGMQNLRCKIYDRWGMMVYEWEGTTGNWNGMTKNGNKAVDGTYYYAAELVDFSGKSISLSGFFQLIGSK
jgi:gliding motility-associated-like protein